MKFSKVFFGLVVPLLIVAVIVLIIFGRTMGSYFLEDDFGEVHYVSQIFAGNWHKLLSNFTGNYMQIENMKVYRPILLLSIMSDYALWRTNACGYFITNIVFLAAAAMMLYMVLRQLTNSWGIIRSTAFSLLSAALFASSPLHCESISLMVGRVDVICSFFYLLALWAFIRKGSDYNLKLLVLGLLSFWAALLTKEMAVGLPVVLTVACFLFPGNLSRQSQTIETFADEKKNESFSDRFKLSLLVAYPAWISLLLYFILRRLTLGTFTGGYMGSIGLAQYKHIFEKWTDLDTITRIIFPFNSAIFGDHTIYHFLLASVYFVLIVLIILRIIILGMPRAWLVFLVAWAITGLLPIYQLWGLGCNLEGARFLFFLTIPLAVLIPALIFAPVKSETKPLAVFAAGLQGKRQIPITIVAVVTLLSLIILQIKVAAKNNIPWLHAGKQTRALLEAGQKLAASLPRGHKVIILGIPKQIDGAHVIYNGRTFEFLMEPPFAKEVLSDHFITFDPVLFGNSDLINTQRFKDELLLSGMEGCYLWRPDKLAFEEIQNLQKARLDANVEQITVSLPQQNEILFPFDKQCGLWEPTNGGLNIAQCENGVGFVVGPLEINPLACDFIDINTTIKPSPSTKEFTVFWQGTLANAQPWPEIKVQAIKENQPQALPQESHYRIALSRYWRWFTQGSIRRIGIRMPPAESIFIKNISLVSDQHILPRLTVVDQKSDNKGVYIVGQKGLVLQVNGDQIENCAMIKLEFSKPDYFFDDFAAGSQECVLTSMIVNGSSGKNVVGSQVFPATAYYQVRAIALNKEGVSEGGWSDPVTIQFDAAKL